MTGSGFSAFCKSVIGMWVGAIVAVALIITLLIFAPWLLALIVIGIFGVAFYQRQENIRSGTFRK